MRQKMGIIVCVNEFVGKAIKTTQHMDTNDLTRETYSAIIDTAKRFPPDLTLQFRVLSGVCRTDI